MTIREACLTGEEQLRREGLPSNDAALLLAHALGTTQLSMFAHEGDKVKDTHYALYASLIAQRCAGFSVATLKGFKEFYDLNFKITPDVLVPRPDTEILVDAALAYIQLHDALTILDMGTGSGCVIITLATRDQAEHRYIYEGSDISEPALAVARENAKQHQVNVHFFAANLFERSQEKSYGLIIANLPYLTTVQLSEPSIQREPRGSLWGGSDGLDIYRVFFSQAPRYTARNFCIVIEFDPSQRRQLYEIASRAFPQCEIDVLKDLANHDRVLRITSKPT